MSTPVPPSAGVVVVGSVNVDYVLRVARHPAPGETVGARAVELLPGGKGANQAVAAAVCGAEVSLVARVGDDPLGARRLEELAAYGIDLSHVQPTGGASTGQAFVTLAEGGDNSIVVAAGANGLLGAEDLRASEPLLSGAAVLVLQLEVPLEVVRAAISGAGPATKVLLNCSPFTALPDDLLSRVHLLVVNEQEAEQLLGRSPLPPPEQVASRCQLLGPAATVVTLGARGALLCAGGRATVLPAPPARVVDTTGAGDAFLGALAARLAAADDLLASVRFAVRVATATTERLGTAACLPAGLPTEQAFTS